MGDCATWIKNFPKSFWFKFTPETKVQFAMDGFHFSQALKQLTTIKHDDIYNALTEIVIKNDKKNFKILCNQFKDLYPERSETIENKTNYILNNWNERQLYQNNTYMKCSMESHISHMFADLFTSRPKAYSQKGLRKLLELRVLKINGIKINIKDLYLQQLINSPITKEKEKIIKMPKCKINEINKYDIEHKLMLNKQRRVNSNIIYFTMIFMLFYYILCFYLIFQ